MIFQPRPQTSAIFFGNLLFISVAVSSWTNIISTGSRLKQCLSLFRPSFSFVTFFLLYFFVRFVSRCFFLSDEMGLFCNVASCGKWNLNPDEKPRRRCLIVDIVPRVRCSLVFLVFCFPKNARHMFLG